MNQLTQDMDAKSLREIGEQLHSLYRRGPFGRVLKTEIDGTLFRAYVQHQHRLKRHTEDLLGIISSRKMCEGCRYACESPKVVLKPCWNKPVRRWHEQSGNC